MAEIYVTSTADSGAGSLRQAIADASDGDVILFDSDVFPQGQTTSILLSSYIEVNKSVSIYCGESDGQGGYTSGAEKRFYVYREVEGVKTKTYINDENPTLDGETLLFELVCRVALDGQETTAITRSTTNPVVTFAGIKYINGQAANGGAVYNYGTSQTTWTECQFSDCVATSSAGAVRSDADAVCVLNDCVFNNCSVTGSNYAGAVITTQHTHNTFNNCVFSSCSAQSGGAVYMTSYSVNDLIDCVFVNCSGRTSGGAVYTNTASQNSLTRCVFDSCSAGTSGGAVYAYTYSQNVFDDCIFKGCTSAYSGAGLLLTSATQNVLNNCVITGCRSSNGGGVYATLDSQNTLNDCTITDCSATSNGGGVLSSGTSQNTLNGCTINDCSATSYGGGVYSANTSQNTLNDCTINDCSANNGGGVYSANASQSTLNACTINDCRATNGGAVFLVNTSQCTLTNCTISGCSAGINGGGLYIAGASSSSFTNCKIIDCTASTNGGGVLTSETTQNTFSDCIISRCSAINGGGIYGRNTSQNTLNNCILNDNTTSSGNGTGLYIYNDSVINLNNCTFVNNSAAVLYNAVANINNSTFDRLSVGSSTGSSLATANIVGITTAKTLTLRLLGVIAIADGAALTITTSATIEASTFTSEGRGYLAVAPGIDTSAATFDGVVLCSYGAGLDSFSARETTRTEIKLDWTQTDTTIPVLVEQKVGDSWETVVESTAGTYNVTVEPATRHLFRAFDGVSFHVDAAWHGIEAPQYKVVGIIVEADAQDVNWQAITEVVNVDGAVRSGQSITILARIYDAYDNETVLLNEAGNIVSVVYTLEKRSKSLFDYTWTPVEGHNEVEVSSECVLEDLQTSNAWTIDEDGYSFVLTPDTTEHTLFATPGVYRFRVKITLAEGNPVVFYEEINVVDE